MCLFLSDVVNLHVERRHQVLESDTVQIVDFEIGASYGIICLPRKHRYYSIYDESHQARGVVLTVYEVFKSLTGC